MCGCFFLLFETVVFPLFSGDCLFSAVIRCKYLIMQHPNMEHFHRQGQLVSCVTLMFLDTFKHPI
jgi:hypothetical protein